jgi:cell division transport system permease protein
MFTTLARIIKHGIQGFWRNSSVSTAAVLVMVIALLVFTSLIIFDVLTKKLIFDFYDKIDISVYFKREAPEDDILNLSRSLGSLTEVKNVEYISRDKALEIFKEKNKDNTVVIKALNELEVNPLLASLNVKARDPKNYSVIAAYLGNEKFKTIIEKVTYIQKRAIIERLAKILDIGEKLGMGLTIFLAFIAALVTFNTIRLAIYSNREEIGIMRLVGASNVFINGPYVFIGIIYGLIAAILSLIIAAPLISFASPYISVVIPEMNVNDYFYANLLSLFGYQLLFGVSLGIISSIIAVRKYLKI